MRILFLLLAASGLCSLPGLRAQDTTYYELWNIDNLENIGGHAVKYTGDPQVVETGEGKAVEFDGDGDRLLIDANPIGESKEFTVEVVFWPEASYPDNADPRFVHIQDTLDPQQKRVMIELRLNASGECYLDGFMLTDNANLPLIDDTKTHPTETWLHAAITYKDGVFSTYMEGVKELSGSVSYQNAILGPTGSTSLGARMDRRNWFNGKIRTLKVTRKALEPEEFLINGPASGTGEISGLRLNLYPVPADQMLHISSSDAGNLVQIRIKDVVGKEQFSKVIHQPGMNDFFVRTADWQSGIYLVQVLSEDFAATRSIIIRH